MFVAVEGWGKSSYIAHAPSPAILMARGETGYLTLLQAGLAPQVPYVTLDSWPQTLALIDDLIANPQGVKTLALDAARGFERLCHEHVCAVEFKGEWGEKGFMAFHKGYTLAVNEWIKLLARLDAIRERHGMGIIMVSHSRITKFQNPEGSDYDRYQSDLHEKTWAPTHAWADMVLFGTHVTHVDSQVANRKGKASGGTDRVVYTERRAAWDAKNRYGLPEAIDIPGDKEQQDYAKVYETIHAFIKGQ